MQAASLRLIPLRGRVADGDGCVSWDRLLQGIVLGRDAEVCGVCLEGDGLSRSHAQLWATPGGALWVRDLGSRNGTWLDGRHITAPSRLDEGVELSLGPGVVLAVQVVRSEARPIEPQAPPVSETAPPRRLRGWLWGAAAGLALAVVAAFVAGSEPAAEPPEVTAPPPQPVDGPLEAAPPSPTEVTSRTEATTPEPLAPTPLEDTLLLEDHIRQLLLDLSEGQVTTFRDDAFVERVEETLPMFVDRRFSYWRGYCRWPVLGVFIAELFEREMRELGHSAARARGLAPLVWVESNLFVGAESAVGATGAWQFMAGTWQRYQTADDATTDRRCDWAQATRYAAEYFDDIFETCGDAYPFLAIAGYNWGEQRSCRLQADDRVSIYRRNTMPFTAHGLVPEETRDYIPKFVAATFVLAHTEAAVRIAQRERLDLNVPFLEPGACDALQIRVPEARPCP
ncbi:MAG: FHA domain-containing protein [Alphaproteobacteria bacterium]|nr:FHA domain-containing protein [Alphaproteobacteria bacterium]